MRLCIIVFALMVSLPPTIASAARSDTPPGEYVRIAREHALRHGLDYRLVVAIMRRESAFNPRALSPKGAMGLMQLMPGTAQRFGVRDPFDPVQNVRGACAYLAWLLNRYEGNLVLTLAAYNAGEAAVDRHGGVPPYAETRAYVAALTGGGRSGHARSASGLRVEWSENANGSRPLFQRPSWGGPPNWR